AVRLTRWLGSPPPAFNAVSRRRSACSNCSTTSSPTMRPSAPRAVWPARKTNLPASHDTAWEKPDGAPSSAGLTRSIVHRIPSSGLDGPAVHVDPLAGDRPVGDAEPHGVGDLRRRDESPDRLPRGEYRAG